MLTITKDNFGKEVEQFSGVVLVDFWAPWCGPCRMVAPVLEELAEKDFKGDARIKFGKINVDEEQELATRFKIRGIPTIKIFKNGQEVEQFVGAAPKTTYLDIIKRHL